MNKDIDATKHNTDSRAHIPSKEEAGYEAENPKVQTGNKTVELPKNPVVHRGQDPELFWLNKYGNDDRNDVLSVDIRSLYRHEHVAPETLIRNLYKLTEQKQPQDNLFSINALFGNALERDELDKISDYYTHSDGWTNRLIQGDSLLVMASLLEREGMAGQVQCIYLDPPYGIKYGGNWQVRLNSRDVQDGSDEALSGEPEQIKAFRDTWELGIHSYLSYLRDRLLIAKELLTESGSCFVQISDENVHLVRSIMDEVFGSENFVSLITVRKTGAVSSPNATLNTIGTFGDFIVWYAKDSVKIKYRPLYIEKIDGEKTFEQYNLIEKNGQVIRLKPDDLRLLDDDEIKKVFQSVSLESNGYQETFHYPIIVNGKSYKPASTRHWSTTKSGIEKLISINRVLITENKLRFKKYLGDFSVNPLGNIWTDLMGSSDLCYVVQTNSRIIERCMLMTTDPGDLVLDPTCGSGTTAYVAEQWGRRWITIDTSRIALNIAKQRLMTAVYPYYQLYSESQIKPSESQIRRIKGLHGVEDDTELKIREIPKSASIRDSESVIRDADIRQGFVYKTVPHITLKSLANDEPPATETLYDQPEIDKKRLRVSGAFTVETLQNYEPITPEQLEQDSIQNEQIEKFEEVIKQHLLSAGIKNGRKNEQVTFRSVETLANEVLHAEGFYLTDKGEQKAYFHIGQKFGTVSKNQVNQAIKECRAKGDADWLVILGFSFESNIEGSTQTTSVGSFEVTKCRIHDDLLQEGLKKKPAKSAASFVTIGEPDIKLHRLNHGLDGLTDSTDLKIGEIPKSVESVIQIEVCGLDIYDPIKDEIKARNLHDIAYWMVDDNYDGSNFIVTQVFFCGGDKHEFDKWKKGLDTLAKDNTRKKLEKTLKIEIDEEAFARLYGFVSHPIATKKGQKIAVRIVSQFGEECTKMIQV